MAAIIPAVAAVAAAGISAYSASETNSANKKLASKQSPNQPYLNEGYQQGADALHASIDSPGYQGPWSAGVNPDLQQSWDRMGAFSNGAAYNNGQSMSDAGALGMGQFGNVINRTNDLYSQGTSDPTQNIINRAGQYANNPYMDGMVDAAGRDISRNLDMSVAQNNANAVAGGNMNSTRAGVTEAMLKTNAADRMGDISAQLRGQTYGQGLTLGAQTWQNGISNGMNANAQGMSAVTNGANMLGTGTGMMGSAIGMQNTIGTQQRGVDQDTITGNKSAADYYDNRTLDLVQKYQNIVSGNSVVPQTPGISPLQAGLGGGMMAAGMAGQMGWKPFANSSGGAVGSPTSNATNGLFNDGGAQGTWQNSVGAASGNYATGYGNYVSPANAQYYP